jgi:glutamine amidotransferase
MQRLFDGSDESPDVDGLGVFAGRIRRLPDGVKHPQMQWNVLQWKRSSELGAGLPVDPWVYFVHSYAADAEAADVVATCDYGGPVTAMVERGSTWATQFHPEKSGANGLHLLGRFVDQCR